MTAIVIACSEYKNAVESPAKDLYFGALFRAGRRTAQASGLPWLILSAKHGLLHPDTMVKPYDEVLGLRDDRLVAKVRLQLRDWTEVVALCSAPYADLLLRAAPPGVRVRTPLFGLSIGRQRAYMNSIVRNRGLV